jgi:hypothetical protein
MGRFFRTKVRPRLKWAARAVGIKEKRSRLPKNIPVDFDPQTIRILEAVNAFTMTSPERIQSLVNAVRYVVASGIDGGFIECGAVRRWRSR